MLEKKEESCEGEAVFGSTSLTTEATIGSTCLTTEAAICIETKLKAGDKSRTTHTALQAT